MAAAFGAALFATLIVTPAVVRLACRLSFFDVPAGYKGHARPTPYLGGAAVLVGVSAAALFGLSDPDVAVLLAAVTLVACLGTVDDRVNLGPGIRLVLVALLAVALWASDRGWEVFDAAPADVGLTVLWTLAVVNSFNLLDNIDGATPTVAAVAGAGVAVLALVRDEWQLAALAAGTAGACVAFLRYNLVSPARVFLGDGGSMPLGLLVAGSLMIVSHASGYSGAWACLLAAVPFVGVPALDTALVLVSRKRRGAPLWTGGRDHLTHRLLARLGSPRKVALVLMVAQGLLVALGIWLMSADDAVVAGAAALYLPFAIAVIVAFERPSRRPVAVTSPERGAAS